MNLTLWITPWALVAAALIALFVGWAVVGGMGLSDMGHAADVDYLLWSGWVSFALYVVIVLYSLRKYIHKLGISPEFKWKATPQQVEKAEGQINELRRQALAGVHPSKKEILARAKQILDSCGVQKVMKVVARKGGSGAANSWEVEIEPTHRLFTVAAWLHVHLWGGIAAAFTVALHGGLKFSMDNPMGLLLNMLSYVVILTGIIGIALWTFGPSWVTKQESDFTLEESFAFQEDIERKVEPALAALGDETQKKIYTPDHESVVSVLRDVRKGGGDFERRAAAALAQFKDHKQAPYIQDVVALMGQANRVRAYAARMKRVKNIMNAWRALHVPISVALMGLVVVHIVQVWWY